MTEPKLQKPGELIRPTGISETTINEVVSRLYGLTVTSCKEFNSYDDRNYYVTVSEDSTNEHLPVVSRDGYILKVLNTKDSKNTQYIEAMNGLLEHLDAGEVRVTKPQPNKNGALYSSENFQHGAGTEVCAVRLFNFIPGDILKCAPYEPRICYDVGRLVAKMDSVLLSFSRPFYDTHNTVWSLSCVPDLEQHLHVINDESDRRIVSQVISAFKNDVMTVQDHFKRGIIHGDTNEQNILVQKIHDRYEVAGIIDAGDATSSYLVFELAISIAYIMIDSTVIDNIDAGGHVLAGYLSMLDLNATERDVLRVCVAARLVQSLVMGMLSYNSQPGNEYLLTTSARGWPCLRKFWRVEKDELYKRWERIVSDYEDNNRPR